LAHVDFALQLVEPFVVADLAEKVSEVVAAEVVTEGPVVRLVLSLWVLLDEKSVFVFGVVLEVGVQPTRPCWSQCVHPR
jgi:hypothetical protein